ncbi:MAG: type II toxin-antitoxin system PemK/MazF family toxin [Methylophilus sp.]|uniref:type II toxin-antitoxin system PemK/MazF family toxin n=1 Tax=Methylophilus sp. TaxID=29541 RepID=UPI003FA16D0C
MVERQTIWWSMPAPGDIVWCHYPEGMDSEPGPKPRPVIVVTVSKDNDGNIYVTVAYGTSKRVDALISGEFSITKSDIGSYTTAGLSYPTKFSFSHMRKLPFSDLFFKPPPGMPFGNNPKLGTVHSSLYKRMSAAHAAVNTPAK